MNKMPQTLSNKGCICCNSLDTTIEPTLTSLFLSRAAWNGTPEHTELLYCNNCGFRTYNRILSAAEAIRYYSNYLSLDYISKRSKDELFYNIKKFNSDEIWRTSLLRQKALLDMIRPVIPDIRNLKILDYGGGDGQLIANLDCKNKYVFDLSNTQPLPGIDKIQRQEELSSTSWDFIICAETLEHISQPQYILKKIKSLISTNGFIYIELPSQQWKSYAFNGFIRNLLLNTAKKHNNFHKLLDLYSTIFRIKFNILPPFGFVPMREHVNFFTINSIISLGENLSLNPINYKIDPFCGIQVLFKKQ